MTASERTPHAGEEHHLTDRDRAMLDLAGQRWNYAGSLEQRVRDDLGISLTRFWQIVNRLIDDRAALEYAPQLVNRLRRIRSARAETRARCVE